MLIILYSTAKIFMNFRITSHFVHSSFSGGIYNIYIKGVRTVDTTLVFRRKECKYFLPQDKYRRLMSDISDMLEPDIYGLSTVCSVYLDTPDFGLARRSAEAVDYKEKLRIRSYGEGAAPTSDVFFEIKKKYGGIVYKRREIMPLSGAERYLAAGVPPCDSQIMREIDYAMRFYRPSPAAVVSYEREAFTAKNDPGLRLTFDTGVRFRTDRLTLSCGSAGDCLLPEDTVLLEVKSPGGMPLWLTGALNGNGIYPTSFSKYGAAYREILRRGGSCCDKNYGKGFPTAGRTG